MLHDGKDMPKFQTITDQASIEKYGGDRMFFAPPIDYDAVMKRIPCGKLTTVGKIREYFAKQSGADFTEPITAGIFCLYRCLGQSSEKWRQDPLLENTESQWRAELKVSRGSGTAKESAGSWGAHYYSARKDKYQILCQRLWKRAVWLEITLHGNMVIARVQLR